MESHSASDLLRKGNLEEETRKRPLLYEPKETRARRHRTETDIHLPETLLADGDQQYLTHSVSQEIFYLSDNHGLAIRAANSQPSRQDMFTKHQHRRKGNRNADKLRRQTVAVDGIYHAKRVISVEQLPISDDSNSSEDVNPLVGAVSVDVTDSEDEFFLATDFANSLPRSKYTQSVDYLDSLVREDPYVERSIQRR